MEQLHSLAGRELSWKKRKGFTVSEYEMLDGDRVVATLRYRSIFGSLATGSSADGSWTFKRVGFFSPRVTVRLPHSEADLATFRNNTWKRGGTIVKEDGSSFKATTNSWADRLEITNADSLTVVRFHSKFGIVTPKRHLVIDPQDSGDPDLPWLTLLAWYLLIGLQSEHSALMAAAGSVD